MVQSGRAAVCYWNNLFMGEIYNELGIEAFLLRNDRFCHSPFPGAFFCLDRTDVHTGLGTRLPFVDYTAKRS